MGSFRTTELHCVAIIWLRPESGSESFRQDPSSASRTVSKRPGGTVRRTNVTSSLAPSTCFSRSSSNSANLSSNPATTVSNASRSPSWMERPRSRRLRTAGIEDPTPLVGSSTMLPSLPRRSSDGADSGNGAGRPNRSERPSLRSRPAVQHYRPLSPGAAPTERTVDPGTRGFHRSMRFSGRSATAT